MTPHVTPGPARSRLDPEPIPRRDFLGKFASASALFALLFALVGMLRLPKAAVLPAPSKKFRVSLPDALLPGTPYVPPGRSAAVFRDASGIYAISTICTHLGCVIRPEAGGFKCPCHGSEFSADGQVLRGPAPRALPWLKVSVNGEEIVVDEGTSVPPGTRAQA
jgi:cytochrome b6-f complex iron-sulfur subunit